MKFKHSRTIKIVFLGAAMISCGIIARGLAQEQSSPGKERTFTSVEQMPQFSGDLTKYLAENIRYPEAAKKEQIQGRVVIQFVVDKEGNVTNAVLQRDIGGGCGEEALRVVRNMPKWTPGKQANQPVNVYYTLPVSFRMPTQEQTVSNEPAKPGIVTEARVYTTVENMPQSSVDIIKYLAENLRYPEAARNAAVEGRVVAQFIIDHTGKIKDPVIVKGIHPDCDREVLRVLRAMPDWKPGMQGGKAVNVYYMLPVSFKLDKTGTISDVEMIDMVAERIMVYPNPATSEVFIENKSGLQIKRVMVYNQAGSLVLNKPVDSGSKHSINTSVLARGTYTLKLETDKGTIAKKVILK
jgi:TonB family protein